MARRFLSYRSKHYSTPLVGIVGEGNETHVAPCLASGKLVTNLFDLIGDWDAIAEVLAPGEPSERILDVEVLAPLTGRDVLAVAKNYKDHVKEMRVAASQVPPAEVELPMMFTKRATSIIPSGGKIYLHPSATQSVDYEGELGIIIGKAGYSIKKEDAFDYVWGATIVNDISARDRQKLHKQFYIGKSFDTFCPMGPFAIHASAVDWDNLMLETRVNGEVRQRQSTSEVIFDIPTLIENCAAGITLQPGDVIATGTPAGVAAGHNPPPWLKHGDVVEVSVTGLGTLTNVCESLNPPPECDPVRTSSAAERLAPEPPLLALANGKYLNVEVGSPPSPNAPTAVFVHGLGGVSSNHYALIQASELESTHKVITFDLEGAGKSPLSRPAATLTIQSFAEDIRFLLQALKILSPVTLIGHSMGGLIACHFAAQYPEKVNKLFLLAPAGPTNSAASKALTTRAAKARSDGLNSIVGLLVGAGLSRRTHRTQPLAVATVRTSILSRPLEGFARTSLALAEASSPPAYANIAADTLIVIGSEDKMAPRSEGADVVYKGVRKGKIVVLKDVGHWPQLEKVDKTAKLLKDFVAGKTTASVFSRL